MILASLSACLSVFALYAAWRAMRAARRAMRAARRAQDAVVQLIILLHEHGIDD